MSEKVNDISQMPGGEGGEQNQVVDPAPQPETLAEAFSALREAGKQSAPSSVEDGEGEQPESAAGDEDLGGSEPEPAGSQEPVAASGGSDEGEADTIESFDPNPARRALLQQANQYAQQSVQQMFSQQGVKLMDISDLYERDERSGRVVFRNPDDPDRPFNSRFEAQQFCDSINKQINTRFQQEIRKAQQQAIQSMAPQFALLEYAPTYQAMSKDEKEIFDMLIDPYALTDNNGNVIGFNCNLQAMGNQAKAFAQKFGSKQPAPAQAAAAPAQKKNKPTTPALDIPSGASGAGEDDQPKTMAEAFAKINELKKKGNKR